MAHEPGSTDALARRALLAHVRHEIRTPINAILGYSEMLLEDGPAEAAADLQRIATAGRDLLGWVDRLLGTGMAEQDLDWEALGKEIRHAMRTPIDSVLGYCEMLREDQAEAGEAFAADLQRIESSARRLLDLIEDLVPLAAQGAGAELAPAPGLATGIQETVQGAVHALRAPASSPAAPVHAGGRLLVADDNSVDRDLLVRRLRRGGYDVLEAEDGAQALTQIRAEAPDLVLLDVLMPGLNGFQVLDQLKADPKLRQVPVIMLSSWDEADSVARCLAAGADDYLPKPVNPQVLGARIASCIERKRAHDREASHLRQLEEEKSLGYGELIGRQAAMAAVRKQIDVLARTSTPLLIQGERGSGRELVGRLVHRQGPRGEGPLLSIDASSIADSPWGDKLFGKAAGQEGGAASAHGLAYLDLVDGGTILLKNLENLPLAVQERLVRFLGQELPLPGQRRPDARLIATCTGEAASLAAAGRLLPELAAHLSAQTLVLPALRERKRDIPELAGHFLRAAAGRLNKPVTGFEDSALTKLVTYDYPIANVAELEQVVERAVSLTAEPTIGAEEIFLGPPPSSPPSGINLLRLPGALVQHGLRLLHGPARLATAAVFALIIAGCFLTGVAAAGKISTLLVWSLWWPMLMLMFVFAGRIWCAICPMALAGEAVQHLAKPKAARKIPGWMKSHEVAIPAAGFFLILWSEAATGMRHSPFATGLLLLSILAGAVAVGYLFPRRAWCRHLCPLGGFAGVCSTAALLELRPTPDICAAKCKGHDCYTGKEQGAPGCPMFQHLMFVDSNQHCVMCMHCVQNCPNGSPRLNLRWPGRELWSSLDSHPSVAAFVLLLIGLLGSETLIRLWENAPGGLLQGARPATRLLLVTAAMAAGALLAAAAFLALRWQARRSGRPPWSRVVALAPLMTSGFLAFQMGFVPGLDHLNISLGYQVPGSAAVDWGSLTILGAAQGAVLLTGLAATLLALWRLGLAMKRPA